MVDTRVISRPFYFSYSNFRALTSNVKYYRFSVESRFPQNFVYWWWIFQRAGDLLPKEALDAFH